MSFNFSEADALFATRAVRGMNYGDQFQAATKARQKYAQILKDSSNEVDILYSVQQIGRIDIFRGIFLKGIDQARKKLVADECLATIEALKKSIVIESKYRELYLYLFLTFSYEKLRHLKEMENVSLAMKIEGLFSQANAVISTGDEVVGGYDGGGLLRILSLIYCNMGSRASAIHLYNPAKGLFLAECALNTSFAFIRPFPDSMSGADFFENFLVKSRAMLTLAVELAIGSPSIVATIEDYFPKNAENWRKSPKNLASEAKIFLDDTVGTIGYLSGSNLLPKGREPESMYCRQQIVELSQKIGVALSKVHWPQECREALDCPSVYMKI